MDEVKRTMQKSFENPSTMADNVVWMIVHQVHHIIQQEKEMFTVKAFKARLISHGLQEKASKETEAQMHISRWELWAGALREMLDVLQGCQPIAFEKLQQKGIPPLLLKTDVFFEVMEERLEKYERNRQDMDDFDVADFMETSSAKNLKTASKKAKDATSWQPRDKKEAMQFLSIAYKVLKNLPKEIRGKLMADKDIDLDLYTKVANAYMRLTSWDPTHSGTIPKTAAFVGTESIGKSSLINFLVRPGSWPPPSIMPTGDRMATTNLCIVSATASNEAKSKLTVKDETYERSDIEEIHHMIDKVATTTRKQIDAAGASSNKERNPTAPSQLEKLTVFQLSTQWDIRPRTPFQFLDVPGVKRETEYETQLAMGLCTGLVLCVGHYRTLESAFAEPEGPLCIYKKLVGSIAMNSSEPFQIMCVVTKNVAKEEFVTLEQRYMDFMKGVFPRCSVSVLFGDTHKMDLQQRQSFCQTFYQKLENWPVTQVDPLDRCLKLKGQIRKFMAKVMEAALNYVKEDGLVIGLDKRLQIVSGKYQERILKPPAELSQELGEAYQRAGINWDKEIAGLKAEAMQHVEVLVAGTNAKGNIVQSAMSPLRVFQEMLLQSEIKMISLCQTMSKPVLAYVWQPFLEGGVFEKGDKGRRYINDKWVGKHKNEALWGNREASAACAVDMFCEGAVSAPKDAYEDLTYDVYSEKADKKWDQLQSILNQQCKAANLPFMITGFCVFTLAVQFETKLLDSFVTKDKPSSTETVYAPVRDHLNNLKTATEEAKDALDNFGKTAKEAGTTNKELIALILKTCTKFAEKNPQVFTAEANPFCNTLKKFYVHLVQRLLIEPDVKTDQGLQFTNFCEVLKDKGDNLNGLLADKEMLDEELSGDGINAVKLEKLFSNVTTKLNLNAESELGQTLYSSLASFSAFNAYAAPNLSAKGDVQVLVFLSSYEYDAGQVQAGLKAIFNPANMTVMVKCRPRRNSPIAPFVNTLLKQHRPQVFVYFRQIHQASSDPDGDTEKTVRDILIRECIDVRGVFWVNTIRMESTALPSSWYNNVDLQDLQMFSSQVEQVEKETAAPKLYPYGDKLAVPMGQPVAEVVVPAKQTATCWSTSQSTVVQVTMLHPPGGGSTPEIVEDDGHQQKDEKDRASCVGFDEANLKKLGVDITAFFKEVVFPDREDARVDAVKRYLKESALKVKKELDTHVSAETEKRNVIAHPRGIYAKVQSFFKMEPMEGVAMQPDELLATQAYYETKFTQTAAGMSDNAYSSFQQLPLRVKLCNLLYAQVVRMATELGKKEYNTWLLGGRIGEGVVGEISEMLGVSTADFWAQLAKEREKNDLFKRIAQCLTEEAFVSMLVGCTLLTTAPVLKALILMNIETTEVEKGDAKMLKKLQLEIKDCKAAIDKAAKEVAAVVDQLPKTETGKKGAKKSGV